MRAQGAAAPPGGRDVRKCNSFLMGWLMPRQRTRPFVEDCRTLVVAQAPAAGESVSLRWTDGACAVLTRDGEAVRLAYRWHDGDGWRATALAIRLVADRPHLGGSRFYFACPQCGRWARKLHDVADGQWACRHCGRLRNRCQSEGAWVRGLRRARKLRGYLGAEGGAGDPLPPRPKGMRTETYAALTAEIRALEAVSAEAWLDRGHRVVRGIRRFPSRRRWWPARSAWGSAAGPG
jgi:hypothetical protein